MDRSRFIPYFGAVLAVFHTIGFYVFLNRPELIGLTPLNILLCAALVFLSEENLKKTVWILLTVGVGGFVAEWIGTSTGYLFGDYAYGASLGFKLVEVPLILILNWFVIVVASASLFLRLKLPLLIKSVLSGLATVLFDLVLEPVAIRFDFWSWNSGIPVYNYICWFLLGTLFSAIYLSQTKKQNTTAFFLYFIWLAFFGALNLI